MNNLFVLNRKCEQCGRPFQDRDPVNDVRITNKDGRINTACLCDSCFMKMSLINLLGAVEKIFLFLNNLQGGKNESGTIETGIKK